MRSRARIATPVAARLRFAQLDMEFDGRTYPRTRWCAVDVSRKATKSVAYLNVALGERWVIRNAPVFGTNRRSAPTDRYYVPLDVKPGRSITRLSVSTSVTTAPLEVPTAKARSVAVSRASVRYSSNVIGEKFGRPAAAPRPYGGAGFPPIVECRRDVPNQECGKTECGPAAVSNALKWLKLRYGLNVNDDELTIAKMKAALGWESGGVINGAWADRKAKHFNDNNLPFTSRKLPGGQVKQATEEFQRGQIVEVFIGQHIATLICMGQDANGNYWVNAASDSKQGQAGGTISEPITISPNGTTLSGPPWALDKDGEGLRVQNFVVQCPKT